MKFPDDNNWANTSCSFIQHNTALFLPSYYVTHITVSYEKLYVFLEGLISFLSISKCNMSILYCITHKKISSKY